MHRVIKGHLSDFEEKFSLAMSESKAFEAFVNYVALRSYSSDPISPDDLVYEGDDPGIDGVLIFLDDQYVSSNQEIEETLAGRRRDTDATVVFVQSKTSESWDKGEINKFESAVLDFLSDEPEYPHSNYLRDAHDMFNDLISNVGKIRHGKPSIRAVYATTGQAPTEEAREITAAKASLEKKINDTGLFYDVRVDFLGRDEILKLWTAADGSIEVTLPVVAMASFPRSPMIEEGYVATVKALDFIKVVLSDESGKLRKSIFDENVRAYIGEDNDVNAEIIDSIIDAERQKRFGVLNNGVTIISPDVRIQGTEVFLRDFQIVNGCQTSNALFANRSSVTEHATLMVKIIETADAELIDEIVRSTNRQSKVQDEQFLATLDSIKAIERYFQVRGADEDHKLYFERRTNQFADEDVKAIRVFDIREVARAAGSMFLDRPDLASRYPNRLTGEMRDLVFDRTFKEDIYYCSSYALYRLALLFSNNRIDRSYRRFRWHILMAAKVFVESGRNTHLNSSKIKKVCSDIEQLFSADDDQIERLKSLCETVIPDTNVARDELRNASYVLAVKEAAAAYAAVVAASPTIEA